MRIYLIKASVTIMKTFLPMILALFGISMLIWTYRKRNAFPRFMIFGSYVLYAAIIIASLANAAGYIK